MNIIFYLIIFIMGTVFGSFLTLATYRIPLNQNITHEHSYCPSCKHKLNILDLIPVLSYVFLGGKCRYCKKKIGSRYFIIETLTGISFVILALALNISVSNLTKVQVVEFSLGILYIIFLFLIGGIDLEHHTIDKKVLIYGVTISLLDIAYKYIACTQAGIYYNLNRIIIYICAIVILCLVNIYKTKNNKTNYSMDLAITLIIMSLFTYEITAILTVICTLLIIIIKNIINKIIKREKYIKELPIAFYVSISNAIIMLTAFMVLFIAYINQPTIMLI